MGSKKAPKIGDNVYIGPGAVLFGDIEIADNCWIGANAVVNKSFLEPYTYSGAYPFTFRQPIKHKIAFKSTILYPFIP